MDAVMRGLVVYFVLLVLFRLYGRRTLGQITIFDFVLLLVIAEATQQALVGQDYSFTNAFLIVLTLFAADGALSLWKQKSPRATAWIEGMPLVLLADGKANQRLLRSVQMDEDDILSAARQLQGLERLDQIRYAVLEVNGKISIIPRPH